MGAKRLDEDQEQVASHRDGSALVVAGAGSGKTTTVIERTVRLLLEGCHPKKVMLMTFTNKAAKEMVERMISIFGEIGTYQGELPEITTFHQFGLKLIKKYFHLCHRQDDSPSILTESESRTEWMAAMESQGIQKKMFKDKELRLMGLPGYISDFGLAALNTEDEAKIKELCSAYVGDTELGDKLLASMVMFAVEKANQNVLDFDDMIILPIYILKNNPNIADRLQRFLKYVTVDEAQDNNAAQYLFLKLVTGCGRVPTLMVGDDDQSIYEWRGAVPTNMQLFLKEFNAKTYFMVKNYRSNGDIVELATNMVRHNENRLEKKPYSVTSRDADIPMEAREFLYPKKESDNVYSTNHSGIHELAENLAAYLKYQRQLNPDYFDQVVFLYRTNQTGKLLDKAFNKMGIRTFLLNGTGLMNREESLIVMAALRLACNPKDRGAFKRIALILPGIGAKTVQTIIDASKENKRPLFGVHYPELSAKHQMAIKTVDEKIRPLRVEGPEHIFEWFKENCSDWLRAKTQKNIDSEKDQGKLAEELDNDDLIEKKSIEYLENIEIIHERIVETIEVNQLKNPWDCLAELSLDEPHDRRVKPKDAVTLATVHGYKGLEKEEVHVVGWSDGLMPKKNFQTGAIDNPEEERRLAYVALTRGIMRVFLHHLMKYDPYSLYTNTSRAMRLEKSPYLDELRGRKAS